MAEKLEVSQTGYGKYELNQRDLPNSLIQALIHYGLSPLWLLTGEGEMYKTQNKQTETYSTKADSILHVSEPTSIYKAPEKELIRLQIINELQQEQITALKIENKQLIKEKIITEYKCEYCKNDYEKKLEKYRKEPAAENKYETLKTHEVKKI